MINEWTERSRPSRLERRYNFENYTALRDFLDQAAAISAREDLYPDMGFGRDYVNVTVHAEPGSEELGEKERSLASQFDELYNRSFSK